MIKKKELISDIYLLLMLCVFPLFLLPSGYKSLTLTKYIFFAATTVLYAPFGIYFRIKSGKKLGFCEISVICYFAFCALSACFSEYGAKTLLGLGRFEGLLTVFLYCLCFFSLSGIRFCEKHGLYLAASALIFSLISAVQLFDLNPFGFYPGIYKYYAAADVYSSSFLGTIGNIGVAAAYVSVCIPLFFALYCKTQRKIYPAVSALLFALLIYTDIDAGKIGVLGALCIFLPTAPKKPAFRFLSIMSAVAAAVLSVNTSYIFPELSVSVAFSAKSLVFAVLSLVLYSLSFAKIKPRTVICVLCVLLVVFIALVFFGSFKSGIMYELSQILHGNIDDSFGTNRIRIWKSCLALISEKPFFGGGPDTLAKRSDIVFERTSDTSGAQIRRGVDAAHCEPLNIFVNCGVFALIAYLSAVFSAYKKKDRACAAAITGYLLQSLFSFSICITAPFFWIFLSFTNNEEHPGI